MPVTPEIRVARVEQDGRQLALELYRGRGREVVTVRLQDGTAHEVWIGDVVHFNESGTQEPLSRHEGLIGTIARKAEEFALLLRLMPPMPALIHVAARDIEPYPELSDLDPYPEASDAVG